MKISKQNIFNYTLIIFLMSCVLVLIFNISNIDEEDVKNWKSCDSVGIEGMVICDKERINNFMVEQVKNDKGMDRLLLRNLIHSRSIIHNMYNYTVHNGHIYIVGELEYSVGYTPEGAMVSIYPIDTDDYIDYLMFSKIRYLPHLIKINSVTGELTLYNTTQEIPEQERTIYYDMIVKNNLNVKELEVHIPPEEAAAKAAEIKEATKYVNENKETFKYLD